MELQLIAKRNLIISKVWEQEKGNITMKDLAEIFNLPLPSLYRIIKAEAEVNKTK